MVAIDTNILIRFLTHDDKNQFKISYDILKNNEVFLPDTVIQESEWVLRYTYEFEKIRIHNAFMKLFGLPGVYLSHPLYLSEALTWYKQGMDFSDALHLAQCQECKCFYTFDRKLVNKARELTKCPVIEP